MEVFSQRKNNLWNSLPEAVVVKASIINAFKRDLDHFVEEVRSSNDPEVVCL